MAGLIVLVRRVSFVLVLVVVLVLEKPHFSHSSERPLRQSSESIVFAATRGVLENEDDDEYEDD
jgi:hypothetical protein